MHFQPREARIIDMHGHLEFIPGDQSDVLLEHHMRLVEKTNVRNLAACSPIMIKKEDMEKPLGFPSLCFTGFSDLKPYFELAKQIGNLGILVFLHHGNPDLNLLKQCMEYGVSGVKLHNAPIIVEGASPELWLSSEWNRLFLLMEVKKLPVLWHVTQRLTDCPYVGGDRNVYWTEGWKKGISYTNEDLLQVYLTIVGRHKNIKFVSAHQLHLGWDRLARLMDQYENLYIDTSIGCQVNAGDCMYEEDIRRIRGFFIDYSDRILFGTDFLIGSDLNCISDEDTLMSVQNHIRFIRQLRLPFDILQKIFYRNAEAILRLPWIPQSNG